MNLAEYVSPPSTNSSLPVTLTSLRTTERHGFFFESKKGERIAFVELDFRATFIKEGEDDSLSMRSGMSRFSNQSQSDLSDNDDDDMNNNQASMPPFRPKSPAAQPLPLPPVQGKEKDKGPASAPQSIIITTEKGELRAPMKSEREALAAAARKPDAQADDSGADAEALRKLTMRLKGTEEAKKLLENECRSLSKRIENARAEHEDKEREFLQALEEHRARIAELEGDMSDVERERSRAREEAGVARAAAANAERLVDALSGKLPNAQAAMVALNEKQRKELDEVHLKNDMLMKELRSMQVELQQSSEKIGQLEVEKKIMV